MICIYCLQDKLVDHFKKREHVLPKCFGTFKPNNLILKEVVCDDCNQYFGDNLELYLGRDTIEGIERYRYGIKPEKQPKHKRLKFKIAEGELTGIIVTPLFSETGEGIDNAPVLQVGLFNSDTGKYDYYELEDIPSADSLRKAGRETKGLKMKFIFKNDTEKGLVVEKLKKRGYKFTDLDTPMEEWPDSVKEQKQTLVNGIITLDRVIARGLCKIAFNYLAFIQGGPFVLSPNFHGIRDFIRNDRSSEGEFFL